MPLALPIVNGQRYSFASVDFKVNGIPIVGRAVSAISYSDTLEPGVVRGGSPTPLGLTRGEYSAEMTVEMPKEEADLFLAALTQTAVAGTTPLGFMEARFEVDISYAERITDPVQNDHLNGCRVRRIDESHSRGADGLTVRFECFVQYIIRNGKSPLGPDALVR